MLSKLAIGMALVGVAVATAAAGVLIYATSPIEMFMVFVGLVLAFAGWLSWLFIGRHIMEVQHECEGVS